MKNPLKQTVLLIVCLATVFGASRAQAGQCAKETCPPGTVQLRFDSVDCSGTPTYYAGIAQSEIGVCKVSYGAGQTYGSRYDATTQFYTYTVVNNGNCDVTTANANYAVDRMYHNVCTRSGTGSTLTLPSASAAYTSPQSIPAVDTSYPDYATVVTTASCTSIASCTNSKGEQAAYVTSNYQNSPSASCPTFINHFGTFGYAFDGTCYRQGTGYYTSTTCNGPNGKTINSYVGNGCQTIYKTQYQRSGCVPNVGNILTFDTCKSATSTPLPPVQAPSASSPPPTTSTPPRAPPTSTPSAAPPSSTPSTVTPSTATPTSSPSPSLLPSFLLLLLLASSLVFLF